MDGQPRITLIYLAISAGPVAGYLFTLAQPANFKLIETTMENANQLIGCCMGGAKTPFCGKLCPVHNCVGEKGLETCADCGQMDGCLVLGRIAANSPFVLETLRALREVK